MAAGGQWMLPGSELLVRGDSSSSNVAIRCVSPTPAGAAAAGLGSAAPGGSSGGWELVAVRPVVAGEALTIDAKMSNVELLARGWNPMEGNANGPVLRLPNFDVAAIENIAGIAEEASKTAKTHEGQKSRRQLWGSEWASKGCRRHLQIPRLLRRHRDKQQQPHQESSPAAGDREMDAPYSKSLVLCLSYTIRLSASRELMTAASRVEDSGEPSASLEEASTLAAANPSHLSKDDVLFMAYSLILEACVEAHLRYLSSLQSLSGAQDQGEKVTVAIVEEGKFLTDALRRSLGEDIDLLSACASHARERRSKIPHSFGR